MLFVLLALALLGILLIYAGLSGQKPADVIKQWTGRSG